jgi:glutamate racemase
MNQGLTPSDVTPSDAIGVFDSGVGGLTVLKEIVGLMPREHTVYLGDTARVPYGTRSASTIKKYALQTTGFLVSKGVKMLVVACNTSAAVALPTLRRHFPGLPVVGVIEPGARAAAAASTSGRIGVIGTEGTIRSGAYERAILRLRPEARIVAKPCPLFVSLAEEGWTEGKVARLVAREYLGTLREEGIDTLVLGCTHYPLLKGTIRKVMGPRVRLIDSAEETARSVRGKLDKAGWREEGSRRSRRRFYVTDLPAKFKVLGRRFLEAPVGRAHQVDM